MNSLDAIYDAYFTTAAALKVVERCVTLKSINEERPFRNTRFHKIPREENIELLEKAKEECDI
ncbi:MAG: hypothetical protein NTX50_10175, partial [Candidatus Sumerlaeota bacterium]|nr:hypothetical protein [Candidatus Sumerlaeota bacterium]